MVPKLHTGLGEQRLQRELTEDDRAIQMTDLKDFRTEFKRSQTRQILEPLASLFQAASVLPTPFTKSLEGKDYFASPDCERTSGKNFLSNIRTWILRPQPGCFIYKNYQQLCPLFVEAISRHMQFLRAGMAERQMLLKEETETVR